jgi:hypothetical protein
MRNINPFNVFINESIALDSLVDYLKSGSDDGFDFESPAHEAPSYQMMDFVGKHTNDWVIHFTDNANMIKSFGGMYGGHVDINTIAYTQHHKKNPKDRFGGSFFYGFSLDIIDNMIDYEISDKMRSYGSDAVLVNTDTIEVFHHGDDEYQCIFHTTDIKHIIPIYSNYDGQWYIEDNNLYEVIEADSLPEAIEQFFNNKDRLLPVVDVLGRPTNKDFIKYKNYGKR